MHLKISSQQLKQNSLKARPKYIKYTCIRFFYLFYFINFLSAALYDRFEKKIIEVAKNNSQEILEKMKNEMSTQCLFLSYSEVNASTISTFIFKLISFLNTKFPENKLSICVLDKYKPFVKHDDRVLYLKNLILMDQDSNQNIIDKNFVIIKDIKTINQEKNKKLLEDYIRNYSNKCDIFLYEYNCVRDCNFLLSSIFRCKGFYDADPDVVCFYIAIQSDISVVSGFSAFRNYLDECHLRNLFSLKGSSIRLAPSFRNTYNYDIIEGTMSLGSYNFIENRFSCKEYIIKSRERKKNDKKNYIKQTIIDY